MTAGAIIVDLEASWSLVHKKESNKIESDYASPYNPDNFIVLAGVYDYDTGRYTSYDLMKPGRFEIFKAHIESKQIIIAHNAKYDLLWMRKVGIDIMDKKYVDTMLQEYIIMQGDHLGKGLGLDDVAPRYGGKPKDDIIKRLWAAGTNTHEIPRFLLADYLYWDVKNTRISYEGQALRPELKEQKAFSNYYHELLRAVVEMEYNGAQFNEAYSTQVKEELEEGYLKSIQSLLDKTKKFVDDINVFNPNSSQQLSRIVFGLVLKPGKGERWLEFQKRFKPWKDGSQGQLDFAVKDCFDRIEKSLFIRPHVSWLTDKKFITNGGFSVGAKVIESMLESGSLTKPQEEYVTALSEFSKAATWRDSNLSGVLDGVKPDGFVHGQFTQHITVTRRFSSKEPNMQNWPKEGTNPLKKLITSRFEDGVICSADYGQLEFRGAGLLSGDSLLLADVATDFDIHSHTATIAFGDKFTVLDAKDKERKGLRGKAKTKTFRFQYGAMPKSKEDFSIFDAFYGKYFQLARWQDKVIAEIAKTQRYVCPYSGLIFSFPKAGHHNEFEWSTKAKNYPIQSLCAVFTGCSLIAIYRKIKGMDDVKMIITVHDANVLDAAADKKDFACQVLKDSMVNVSETFEEFFGKELDVPLGVDISFGPNWYEQEDWNENG